MKRADKALYHAKDSGRNCAVTIESGKMSDDEARMNVYSN